MAIYFPETNLPIQSVEWTDKVEGEIKKLDKRSIIVGPQGAQGPQGETGASGSVGEQGPQGEQGPEGPQGPQGEQGLQGESGQDGINGEQGPQGIQGESGKDGLDGAKGDKGEKGDAGPVGPKGDKGVDGDSAYEVAKEQGFKGTKKEWLASLRGSSGAPGQDGTNGTNGTNGVDGATGPTGPQGATGFTGPQGPAGVGVPSGGTTGQVLAKIDGTDYSTYWTSTLPSAGYTSVVKHEVKLGEAIAKGQAVYVSSADGTNMIVSKASNTSEQTSSKTMGLLETGGAHNDKVNVITEGLLSGLDTSTATAGDAVWLGTNGNLIFWHYGGSTTKPSAPAHLVFIGIVTRANANNGEIFVKPQNGFELNELHDVDLITSPPADGDVLEYDSATSLWKNRTLTQANIARLAGGNSFTEAQTILGTVASNKVLEVKGASGQSASFFEVLANAGNTLFRVNATGYGMTPLGFIGGGTTMATNARNTFYTAAAASIGLVIQGAASQSANLQEWQDSTGTIVARISPVGQVVSNLQSFFGSGATSISNARFNVATGSASVIGAVIRGAASQSANLTEWQDSAGAVLLHVTSAGNLNAPGQIRVGTTSGLAQLSVVSSNAATIASVIRGAASQSASLTEWQNSAGTRLSSIASNGLPYLTATSTSNIDMYTAAADDMALMLPADDWDDKLRFLYGLYERSTDGTTGWTVNTFDPSIVDGRMDTIMSLPTASLGHRFTWFTTNFQYMTPRYLRISSGYPGATSSTISVLIESSADNSTWFNRGSYTGITAYIMKRLLRIADNGDHSYIRVTITYTAVVNPMQLENIELLTYRPGNQGGNVSGVESRLPISSWDGNRTNVVQASHSGAVSQVVRAGVVRSSTINNAVGNGTTVTFTTASPHVFRVGQSIAITGVNPTAYNITGTVASITGMSGFTITNAATGTYVSGGTATITSLFNPFEVQNAAGTVLAAVAGNGTFQVNGIGITIGDQRVGTNAYYSAALNVLARATTEKGLVVRGQPSQTANHLETQDTSGTTRFYIDSAHNANFSASSWFQNSTGKLTIGLSSASAVGLTVKGAASQTANLQEWQDSSAVVHSGINSSGFFFVGGSSSAGGQIGITAESATNRGMVIKGAASQSANLQEWQDSAGGLLGYVNNVGRLVSPRISTGGTVDFTASFNVSANSSTVVAAIVKGAASQTANLQEWQNSSGTALARVTPSGDGIFGAIALGNGTVFASNSFLNIGLTAANTTGMIIKANASQTADLLQIQNSASTNVLRVDSGGNLKASNVATLNSMLQLAQSNGGGLMVMAKATAAASNPGADVGSIYLRDGTTAGTLKLVIRAGASGAETTILDNIPQ